MERKGVFLCASSLACVFSCSNSGRSYDLSGIDSTTVVVEICESGEKELLYSSVYSGVEYVTLESKEESVVGNIEKLEITKDSDYVVFDRANGKILRFGSDGRFLNRIGMMGHSKKEYISPEQMCYDEYSDNVVVYDGAKKCLLHYSLNGVLVHTTPLHKYIADFAVLDKAKIAVCANYRDVLKKGQTAYNLEIIDEDGNILKQYDPYSIDKEKYHPSPTNIFKRCDDKLLFHKYYSPIVYSLADDGIKPEYYIGFKSKQIPSEWLESGSTEEIDRHIFSKGSDVAYCTAFYDTQSIFIVNVTSSNGFVNTVYVDKNDLSVQLRGDNMLNDINGLVPSCILSYNKGKVYGVVSSEVVANFYSVVSDAERLNDFKEQMKDKGYNITPNDIRIMKIMKNNQNPIVQICTLKQL